MFKAGKEAVDSSNKINDTNSITHESILDHLLFGFSKNIYVDIYAFGILCIVYIKAFPGNQTHDIGVNC